MLPARLKNNDKITRAVETALKHRRWRERCLPARLLGEPAWDMMLDLYLNERRGKKISVSALCIAAHAPATTALRWITSLQDEGLIERQSDPRDGRRWFVVLTDKGRSAMEAWAQKIADG